MPRDWHELQFGERARMIIDLFPTLELDVVHEVTEEWSKNEYPDTWHGEQRAINDLIAMLKYASLSDEQKAQEKDRIKQLVRDKLK